MRRPYSLIASILILLVLVQSRMCYPGPITGAGVKVTTWDAFGYYMYLPAIFIYHDVEKLNWLEEADRKYAMTGGDGWQAQKADNGNYVFKYLGGVAIMQLPWFAVGHLWAKATGQPQDGFSQPYQLSLAFGIILYCFLAILLLRRLLLKYFPDNTVAITLLLVCLATNFIQYAAVDNAQSHAYIFVLYVVLLWAAMKWHEQPKAKWAALIGWIIGLATMSRPTEAIMLFIPLLWGTHTKLASKEKWQLVRQHKSHVVIAVLSGLVGVLPQLVYWKVVTGSFIYDVGSKWMFLNPYFRVLFGWEKGWFIYTPVTILFIIGMLFIRRFPFKNPVLWFCLLNIWIIIAWSDWRYGGSYSTRALVQSYPVFALPMAAFVQRVSAWRWKALVYIVFAFLLGVNIFQVWQYNKGFIHYNDMNRLYYSHVYLNAYPTPEDVSLLDHDEFLKNENAYKQIVLIEDTTKQLIHALQGAQGLIISNFPIDYKQDNWIKVEVSLQATPLWQSYLNGVLQTRDSIKQVKVRLFNAISKDNLVNNYAFYIHLPEEANPSSFSLYTTSASELNATVERVRLIKYSK